MHTSAARHVLWLIMALTLLLAAGQWSFFAVHYWVSGLFDPLVKSSMAREWACSAIVLPVLGHVAIQLCAHVLVAAWAWFIAVSTAQLFHWKGPVLYALALFTWAATFLVIFGLNAKCYPHSFFSAGFPIFLNWPLGVFLLVLTVLAYVGLYFHSNLRWLGSFFVLLAFLFLCGALYEKITTTPVASSLKKLSSPNILLIGLDSVRPDFTGFYGNPTIKTPHIDAFLGSAMAFGQAYSPLARTYPAWMTILTGRYPLHHHARANLVAPGSVAKGPALGAELKKIGYETFYATDESRFNNMTRQYGFDRVIGPGMGVNDFLLGELGDFPLSNLLLKLPWAQFLFPYQYANRAAAVTYDPTHFLVLLKQGLAHHAQGMPLFLAVHLCLAHWPYTWATDGPDDSTPLATQYRRSVEAVDAQLGLLLTFLQQSHLLENSLVVLLSDHGTTVGLPGDRLSSPSNFQGSPSLLSYVTRYESGIEKNKYTMDTSYGQGNDLLSLKQNHIVLGIQGPGLPKGVQKTAISLLDIAPTVLDYLHLPAWPRADGSSLLRPVAGRPIFLETGDSFSEIECPHIQIAHALQNRIDRYQLDLKTGLLFLGTDALHSIIQNKQFAVLWEGWLWAHYPARAHNRLVWSTDGKIQFKTEVWPPYYVWADTHTGHWGLLLKAPKKGRLVRLQSALWHFYGKEIIGQPGALPPSSPTRLPVANNNHYH